MRISIGHKHKPVFDNYHRAWGGYDLYYRVALFHCDEAGCTAIGQQEEWPNEDAYIHWRRRDKNSDSGQASGSKD